MRDLEPRSCLLVLFVNFILSLGIAPASAHHYRGMRTGLMAK